MQVQAINSKTNFGHRIKVDEKLISRATAEEKAELAYLKRMFKINGFNEEIKVKNDKKSTVSKIIEKLRAEFDKYEAERIKLRKMEDAFGDEKFILG